MSKHPLIIGLVGGGSGGPLTPLLAVRTEILRQEPKAEFLYFGGNSLPERQLLSKLSLRRFHIPAGKWRRYFSWRNLVDIFLTLFGFFKALTVLAQNRPDTLFSAGSYVSVPVAYAAFLLRIPVVIHQQDVVVSLSNRLVAPIAAKITVALPESVKSFSTASGLFRQRKISKVVHTGNPVRADLLKGTRATAQKIFGLQADLPTLLVLGGGGGARRLNQAVTLALPKLTQVFQVIHVTGADKPGVLVSNPRYHVYEFLKDELPYAFAAADIIVSRAGFSTISELVAREKISVLVPIPNSHQEANAVYFFSKGAAVVLLESSFTTDKFIRLLRQLLFDAESQKYMRACLRKLQTPQAAQQIATLLTACARKQKI
ncbi:MAG: UDP-N-acetylglucosamine--N-acetylmuramyl-(pentapeptide) pyrophosphoryl-undecaprenol N-acetylglucosamine transferase [Patescibacteria group bacterium]|nr:UDP-N-acetylglucosamine--N-acetylmuramyl-(pentapeptide) pyrophosphoryl-undecaprenol N-acetylglucosamine transferase [Patescibacteria group bacterium]